jgi:transcriptional regulator of aromatic amino acid metabolism
MGAGVQAKLLRVLEDGHYRRVGSTTERHADVRVVAATNRALEEEIKTGRFCEDLYYRLNVLTIALPPLRERRQDIPELVEHFRLNHFLACFVPEFRRVLHWPSASSRRCCAGRAAEALGAFSPQECRNYFRHCGYAGTRR